MLSKIHSKLCELKEKRKIRKQLQMYHAFMEWQKNDSFNMDVKLQAVKLLWGLDLSDEEVRKKLYEVK